MRNVMSWIKIAFINLTVLIVLISTIEIGAGLSRVFLGKEFLPFFSSLLPDWVDLNHPCVEMKTDVLLDHVPNHLNKCDVKDGVVNGEYVFYKYAPKHLPKILTLGGSTTSGFYQHLSSGDTYPKLLAEMVSKTHFLVNGGVGGYSSLQEFFKFSRDGSRIDNLDIVISLNGINDIPGYHGLEAMRVHEYPFLTSTQYSMNQKQIWIDQRIDGGLLTKVLENLLPNVNSLFVYFNDSGLTSNLVYEEENRFLKSTNAAQRWQTNIKRLNALASLENIKYFVFLQPTLGLSGAQSAPASGTSDELIFNKMDKEYATDLDEFYNQLKLRCAQLTFCIDISNEVLPSGNNYNDPRHHNRKGNKVLAELIFERIFAPE